MTLQTRQIALLHHLNDENNVFSMANQSREAYNEHYEYWKPYAVIIRGCAQDLSMVFVNAKWNAPGCY